MLLLVTLVVVLQPIELLWIHADNLTRRVTNIAGEDEGQANCQDALNQEEPTPALKSAATVDLDDPNCEEGTKSVAELTVGVQDGCPQRNLLPRVVHTQVVEGSREESSLHETELYLRSVASRTGPREPTKRVRQLSRVILL